MRDADVRVVEELVVEAVVLRRERVVEVVAEAIEWKNDDPKRESRQGLVLSFVVAKGVYGNVGDNWVGKMWT